MSLLRRTVPTLALLGAAVGSLTAQIPIRQGNATPANAPRLLVATTYTDRAADSATAVAIGNALRTRFQRVVNTSYQVLTREQMNRALAEYSYPADAILNRASARQLASSMQSRIMLFSELGREGTQLRVRARFAGLSDDAGTTIVVRQVAGQSNQQFGEAIAVAFTQAVKAQVDAKACMDQSQANAVRATESATKALRNAPTHGLAHFCLAIIAERRSPTDPAYATELDLAVRGDSLALPAMARLADLYTTRGDTANVILKWQEMIEADPTNRDLIERASRVFRSFGRPDAAEQVADRGIALDSLDTAMWDLRSGACLFQSKYTCSVWSLERIIAIDSARADSNLVFRLAITAGSIFQDPDSTSWKDSTSLKASWLKWSEFGVQRWPNNKNLLGQLMQAYAVHGRNDDVLRLTDRVIALDSTDVQPALTAIQILVGAKRWAEAARYGAFVLAKGDDQQKLGVAGAFTNASRTLLTTQPTDPEAAYGLQRIAVPGAGTDARVAPLANFLYGFAALGTASKQDAQAQAERSCDIARRMDGLVDEARVGFTVGRSVNPAAADQQLTAVNTYKARTTSMITAYCR